MSIKLLCCLSTLSEIPPPLTFPSQHTGLGFNYFWYFHKAVCLCVILSAYSSVCIFVYLQIHVSFPRGFGASKRGMSLTAPLFTDLSLSHSLSHSLPHCLSSFSFLLSTLYSYSLKASSCIIYFICSVFLLFFLIPTLYLSTYISICLFIYLSNDLFIYYLSISIY